VPRVKVSHTPPGDDDLLPTIRAIGEFTASSDRVVRSRIDNGEIPIFVVGGVIQSRKSLIRAADEQRAREYAERVRENIARGIKFPGRPKNVKKAKLPAASQAAE